MKRNYEEYQASLNPDDRFDEEILEAKSNVRIFQEQEAPGVRKEAPVPNQQVRPNSTLSIRSLPFVPEGPAPPVVAPNKSTVSLNKDMYINMLAHYNPVTARDCMLRFREVFFPKMHTEGFNEPKTIKHVMMTCFGFELELLSSVVQNSKKLLVYNDSSDAQFVIHEAFQGHQNMTVILPAKPSLGWGSGAFHPKLWLIEFESGVLRVVVGSGNLSIGDWSVWSNCLWYQDFKKKVVTVGSSIEASKEPNRKLGSASADFYPYLNNFVDKLTNSGNHHLKK